MTSALATMENAAGSLAMLAMVVLPPADGKLLELATGTFIPPGIWRRASDILAAAFGASD